MLALSFRPLGIASSASTHRPSGRSVGAGVTSSRGTNGTGGLLRHQSGGAQTGFFREFNGDHQSTSASAAAMRASASLM